MKATGPRRAALATLAAVRRGDLADRALAAVLDGLPARDRPWTQELVYGTLRLRGRIDFLLARHVRRGLDSLEPPVLDVLRLGAYQLLEMASVPAYAAVSQAVELARRAGGRGSDRLVNAVLQALARQAPDFDAPDFEADPVAYLVHWGSHPRWLVERWIRRFGAGGARALVEANNRRPELFVRPVGLSVGAAAARLRAGGVDVEPVPSAPDALRLPPPGSAAAALELVPGVVQDPAAGLVVRYAAPAPDARIADLCAAPGGKAIALAESAGYVVAADVSVRRIERLRQNVERIGRTVPLPIGLAVADARRPPLRRAEMVLLDVPCTGTGTLRRHPDGKWRVTPEDLATLTRLQAEMLDSAAPLLDPGGVLVYATCSLEPEENEVQVESFLKRHPAFERTPSPAALEADLLDELGQLVVLPHVHDVDGAFAARLRRAA